ncbi:HAD family hydrolase [Streptococcus dentasini]
MIKLIIFDMDGVIVDTEYLDFQLQQNYIKQIAHNPSQLTFKDFSELVGRSGQDLLERIKRLSQTSLSLSEIAAGLGEIERVKYRKENCLSLFRKDVLAVLEYARAEGIALALASSTKRDYIKTVLTTCGIKEYFDAIVSGEDFEKSKPNPEIYLAVLERLAISSGEALAIEDSPSGIAAAKGADLTVLAYREDRLGIDQSLADYMAEDMRDILAFVKKSTS